MDQHTLDEMFQLLQQVDARLIRIEEKLNQNPTQIYDLDGDDPLLADAAKLSIETKIAKASLYQRHLQVGYARAARILDQLAKAGVISQGDGAKPRKVFVEAAKDYLKSSQ
jgi:S-DNA-T family DNA segregation ATPase FtsK/SpoIIIE